jgi:molybdopterin converting factor small subunit
MTVRVLFFGPLADLTGSARMDLTLPESSSVQSLLDTLFERWPALRAHDASLLTAINLTYARRGETIPPDAEVAIMPPVQGGEKKSRARDCTKSEKTVSCSQCRARFANCCRTTAKRDLKFNSMRELEGLKKE